MVLTTQRILLVKVSRRNPDESVTVVKQEFTVRASDKGKDKVVSAERKGEKDIILLTVSHSREQCVDFAEQNMQSTKSYTYSTDEAGMAITWIRKIHTTLSPSTSPSPPSNAYNNGDPRT